MIDAQLSLHMVASQEHLDGKYRAWFYYEPIGRATLTVHCRPCNESRAFPRALI